MCEHPQAYIYKTWNPGGDKKITRQRVFCDECHSDMIRERDVRTNMIATDGSSDGLRASFTDKDETWHVVQPWGSRQENKMETAIKIAAETYSKLNGKMNTNQVLAAIADGDQVILRSVLKLMEVTA